MKYPQLPNPFEDMPRRSFLTGGRGGRSKIIPVLAAEPAISRTIHGGEAVGRTVGSNPATGAKRKRGRPRKGEKREKGK